MTRLIRFGDMEPVQQQIADAISGTLLQLNNLIGHASAHGLSISVEIAETGIELALEPVEVDSQETAVKTEMAGV